MSILTLVLVMFPQSDEAFPQPRYGSTKIREANNIS